MTLGVTLVLSRCVCVRHINLGGKGNALYPVLSSWVLGFIGFFRFFYLNKQLGSLLIDLAHQQSFLDSPVL